MKIPLSLVFTFALPLLVVAPAAAQKGRGQINQDAPTVTAGIEFKNSAKISVRYLAIRFGEGKFQSILKNKDRQERFNKFAANSPIGSITTNSDIRASERDIPAGNYAMFFTVSQRGGWILNLKDKDSDANPIRFGMRMKDTEHKSPRLSISLTPDDKTGVANITFSFGGKYVTVPMTVSAPAAKKQADK